MAVGSFGPLDGAAHACRARHLVMLLTTARFNSPRRRAPNTFELLRCLLVGGERAIPKTMEAVRRAAPPQTFRHMCDPAESDDPHHGAPAHAGRSSREHGGHRQTYRQYPGLHPSIPQARARDTSRPMTQPSMEGCWSPGSAAANTSLLCAQSPGREIEVRRAPTHWAPSPRMPVLGMCGPFKTPQGRLQVVTSSLLDSSEAKPASRLHDGHGHVREPSKPVRAGRKQHLDACPPLLSSRHVLPHEGAARTPDGRIPARARVPQRPWSLPSRLAEIMRLALVCCA